ncbi:MAG: DUF992 domain-containing protein [Hyphomicrobiales bacterium]|nr:DUF992 domain-containing protein [Hyphomicrobiales bacterium]
MNVRTIIRGVASLAGVALSISVAAQAWAATAQVGVLKCDTSIGIGEILIRKQTMTCVFTRNDGTTETYSGTIHEYGVELGEIKEAHLIWAVISGSTKSVNGLLSGKYTGVSADVAAGFGAGADLLVGGTEMAFALQPLAVDGETGINIAAGVAQVELAATN